MTYLIRKIYLVITLILITATGYAYEDDGNLSACGESECCISCQPACCGRGFISADLLYWRAFENGLDACVPRQVSDMVTSDGCVISAFSGKSREPHFQWNPGFRIGAGYEFACSNRDIEAFWTHFYSNAHGSRRNCNEHRWNINLDVIDVVAGYECDLVSCFALMPFVGLRGARIHQKLHIGDFSGSCCCIDDDMTIIRKRNTENFLGLGPLIGLEADWNIGCDFSLYAGASVSWLYGRFHVRLLESEMSVDSVDCCDVRKRLDASLASADAEVGISWQKCFCNNMRLILGVGLEHHRYFDFNRMCGYGDLSFDGVNFSAGIEF